jgi:hypothetical protein
MAPDHGVLVQLEKCSGHFLEVGQIEQFFDIHRLAGQHGFHNTFVGERAGGTGHHALPARDARGIAHGQVVIERDAGHEAFAAAAEHIVVANFVASANTAIAQDARFVVHRNHQRRIVLAARREPAGKARLGYTLVVRQSFQFAITRIALAGAGAGMVRHQQFD